MPSPMDRYLPSQKDSPMDKYLVGDTMTPESLMGAAPVDPYDLSGGLSIFPEAARPERIQAEDPVIKRTVSEVLAGKEVAPYSLRALKDAYRYMTEAVVPQQDTVPKELLRHAANIATTPARFTMAFPEFVYEVVKVGGKSWEESARILTTGKVRPEAEQVSAEGKEMLKGFVEPIVSAVKYPFTGDPEDYAKATRDPGMTALPLLIALGAGVKGARAVKGKRVTEGIAKKPVLPEEVLGAEREVSPAEASAAAFERELGVTERLVKSPREAELLKRRLKAGKTLVPDELLGAEKAKPAKPTIKPVVTEEIVKPKIVPKVTRQFQKYTSEQRANRMASHRLSNTAKEKIGEYYYTRADVPDIAFKTRKEAIGYKLLAPSPRGVKVEVKPKQRIRDDLPEAKPINAEIDRIVAAAHKRMVEAKDPAITGLRPTEMDWMTEAELRRVHELQLKIRSKTQGEAKADVAKKRAERLAKPVAKEPWEMTQGEYRGIIDDLYKYSESKYGERVTGETGKLKERLRLESLKLKTITDKGYSTEKQSAKVAALEKQIREIESQSEITRQSEYKGLVEGAQEKYPHLIESQVIKIDKTGEIPISVKRHRDVVKQALASNKPVPTEVLKDYPELIEKVHGPFKTPEMLVEDIVRQKNPLAFARKQLAESRALQKKSPGPSIKGAVESWEREVARLEPKPKAPSPKVEVVETPKEAVAEIIEGKRESTMGTAEFKKRMVAELDKAMETAKEMPADILELQHDLKAAYQRERGYAAITEKIEGKIESGEAPSITIEIPGDGEFKLLHDKNTLAILRQKVSRMAEVKKPKKGRTGREGSKAALREAMERGEVTFEPAKKPSERGVALNIIKEIRDPAGAKRVPYKEAIKAPDRPEMTNMEMYYKSISTQEKLTPDQAVKVGIALRQTPTGKIKPAIRESGAFVPTEFAVYENFKDAKPGVFGGTKDWIRFVQEIDGALSLQKKAKLPGQAGPAEKFILRRTEDIVKIELDWSAEQSLRIQKIIKGLSKKQDKLVTEVLKETSREGSYVETADFATNTRIKKITTDTKIVKAAQESRKLLEHMFSDQNKNRILRGQELINYRQFYAPEILREASLWERAFGSQFKPKEVVQGPSLPDYIKPNKPFNPRELARDTGLKDFMQEKRISKILEDYANTASRDIHHTAIIQNNKAMIQQLETMGYKNAAEGISNYTAESFGGVKPWMDRGAKLPTEISKIMRFWRGSLMRSVFPLNIPWNAFVQTLSSGLTVMRTGVTGSTRGLVDWFANPAMRNRIKSAYSFRVKSQRAGRITHQDINTGLTKMISGKRSTWQAAIDGANYFTELVERELTGWSIASGLRHGAKRGLKGKALWDYASDMGAKTQSMYNLENKPGIIRSEIVQTATPFQTFIFEMYNTAKEFAGKTGTPPGAMTERIGWVLRFTAMAYAGNEISHAVTGRRPWEIYSFIPFSDQTIKPVIDALRGKPSDTARGRSLPSFVGAGVELMRGIRSYLRTGDTRKIRQWGIKYGTAFMKIPGGTQTARMVDGWIAVADGKMKDTRGRTLFKIKDPWEQVRAVTMGPWRTKAGIEYWDKKETGILEDIGIVKPKKKALSPWEVMGGVGKSKKRKKGVDFSKYLGAE